jgi:hypothetical protein
MAVDIKEYAENTITYFRKNYIPEGVEINYKLIDDSTIKFKIPKDHYNFMTAELEKDDFDFEINPADRKMELKFPQHNGQRLLKTKHFDFDVYFVDEAALKTVESITDKAELNIKNWSDFFEQIDPEYRNLFINIVNGIPIATHKNEYNKVISKKAYWLDPQNGLFEKKEKLVNEEWRITYQPVTTNLYQVFRMFFKYFEDAPLNELADFNLFKEIVGNTKYKTYLQ